jgi:nucleoside-diphosphate-sugar epimerase
MAYSLFAQKLAKSESIGLFGHEGGIRSFTDIFDVCQIIEKLIHSTHEGSHLILNIGNPEIKTTRDLLNELRKHIPSESQIDVLPERTFDSKYTHASIHRLVNVIGNHTFMNFEESVSNFANWFLSDYGL